MATTCYRCNYPYCPSNSTCPNCGASTGCFITTAVCENLGLTDDCYELTTLRSFRDRYMTACKDKVALLEQYYSTAPSIVHAIEHRADRNEIYSEILEQFIQPAIQSIESGADEKAKEIYTNMMSWVTRKVS